MEPTAAVTAECGQSYSRREENQARQLQSMHLIASALAGSLGLDDVLSHAVNSLLDFTGCHSGVVYFLNDEDATLVGRNYVGFTSGFEGKIRVHSLRSRSFPSRAFRSPEPLLFDVRDDGIGMPSITAAERRAIEPEDIRSAVACRLESSSKVYGVLVLSSHGRRRRFSSDELSFIRTVCAQIGVAVERTKLYDDLKQRMVDATTLYEMGRLLGSRLECELVLPSVLDLACTSFGFLACSVELSEPLGLSSSFASGNAAPIDDQPLTFLSLPLQVAGVDLGKLFAAHLGRTGDRERRLLRPMADLIAMAASNRRLYQESRRLGIIEERNRLAREIHDGLTQTFFSIQLHLDAAIRSENASSLATAPHVTQARALAGQGLDEARRSVRNLRSPLPSGTCLRSAIETQTAQLEVAAGVTSRVVVSGEERPLPDEVEGEAFRAVRELLHNVHKHAQARDVAVELEFGANEVTITVEDDGVGLSGRGHRGSPDGGFGLIGVRERISALGGHFHLGPGKRTGPTGTVGTRATLSIPTRRGRC